MEPRRVLCVLAAASSIALSALPLFAQAYGEPDRGKPGDADVQAWLAAKAEALHAQFLRGVASASDWSALRARYREEYLHMLGLWPEPPRTPLEATVTGTHAGDGFRVDMLHYQSRPGLYVTANLYRPARVESGERLPAVLYVCGHSPRGRDGNKTAFQSHGIWFARHGYVCLVVDTLQLGEIGAIHHGTYREERWWWHSRGYTPAGVECWNGVRGIDYLAGRDDVDPERIAVTGISGGGAATFWIAAADERVRAAVPVSGMADLPSYVSNRVINGHCDCMFLYNTFEWPWTRIAALVAPRPLLFVNSDADPIFPMDANERVIARLERLYSFFGAGDLADSVVSVGGHAYRRDIRQAAYRFINTHLRDDPHIVLDSEIDLVRDEGRGARIHPIPTAELRVFPEDSDIPEDELNTTIDAHFVPMVDVQIPEPGSFEGWKERLLAELRRVTFRGFPGSHAGARRVETLGAVEILETEPYARCALEALPVPGGAAAGVLLGIAGRAEELEGLAGWLESIRRRDEAAYVLRPRGIGETEWTRKNPPNYVERSFVLLGTTADRERIRDAIAAARALKEARGERGPVRIAGRGAGGVLAAYAALLSPDVSAAVVAAPPASHMDPGSPALLNVLRVVDIPDVLGMLAPRPLRLEEAPEALAARVAAIYRAAGAGDALEAKP